MASKPLYGPLTRYQACPPTCGAAAAVIVSPAFAARHALSAPVEIQGQAMTTDPASSFEGASMMKVIELITYEALGLCPEGGAERFILDGDNTYGGRYVVNPSGGLLSKGHPLGATGLAQCYELTHQLRGTAQARQVEGVEHAVQHNLGLGGACVVTVYGRA